MLPEDLTRGFSPHPPIIGPRQTVPFREHIYSVPKWLCALLNLALTEILRPAKLDALYKAGRQTRRGKRIAQRD